VNGVKYINWRDDSNVHHETSACSYKYNCGIVICCIISLNICIVLMFVIRSYELFTNKHSRNVFFFSFLLEYHIQHVYKTVIIVNHWMTWPLNIWNRVCGWDLAEWFERLTSDSTAMGSILASSDIVISMGRQMNSVEK
jgi:hypothetical protein